MQIHLNYTMTSQMEMNLQKKKCEKKLSQVLESVFDMIKVHDDCHDMKKFRQNNDYTS